MVLLCTLPPSVWQKDVLYRVVLENKERWMELCALAAEEQDPDQLMELTREIIRLLDEKDARLKTLRNSRKF